MNDSIRTGIIKENENQRDFKSTSVEIYQIINKDHDVDLNGCVRGFQSVYYVFSLDDRSWYKFVDLCNALVAVHKLERTIGYGDIDEDNIEDSIHAIRTAISWYTDDIDYHIYKTIGRHSSSIIYAAARHISRHLERDAK